MDKNFALTMIYVLCRGYVVVSLSRERGSCFGGVSWFSPVDSMVLSYLGITGNFGFYFNYIFKNALDTRNLSRNRLMGGERNRTRCEPKASLIF